MVAVSVARHRTEKDTAGLHTAIFGVWLHEVGMVAYPRATGRGEKGFRDKDVVKASPFALVSVGAADAFCRSPGCYVREALPDKVLEAGGGGIVVEIAHDDDART